MSPSQTLLTDFAQALQAQERAVKLLASLDNLRNEGRVEAAQYEKMREQYLAQLTAAAADADTARAALQEGQVQVHADLQAAATQEGDLDLRVRIGEVEAGAVEAQRRSLTTQRQQLETRLNQLSQAAAAKSSADLPQIPALPSAPARRASSPSPGAASAHGAALPPQFDGLLNLLTRLPAPHAVTPAIARYMALASGILLVIAVVALPFLQVLGMIGLPMIRCGGCGVLSLLLGLAVIGLQWVADQRLRILGQALAGVLVIAILCFAMAQGTGGIGSFGFGVFLVFISAAGAVCGAAWQARGQ